MGGAPLGPGNFTPMQSAMAQQATANFAQNLAQAQLANQQAALNQQNYRKWPDPLASQWSGLVSTGVRGVDTRSVSSTAASRVQKADWEQEYDRKDREVDEMIERQRQERERVRIEEDGNVVEAEKHSEASSGSFGYDGGNEG